MKQVARLWLLAAALLAITLLGAAIASAQGRTAGTSAATTLASAPAAEESGENPAGEGGEGEKTYELPNFMEWIYELIDWKNITNLTFCFIVVILLCTFVIIGTSKRALRPKSRFYLFLELIAMALYDFFYQVLGKDTRKYISLIGTLFIYILCLNLFGLIPLMKSPTSVWGINAAMALAVFFYVQYTGFVRSGFVGYFKHLLGEPLWLAPLMFPLHLVGELIKPVSLSLRLFGNILGEDTLLAVFAGLLSLGFINFPLHLPFMFMAVLFSTIQALIFSMLTAVYISLMLPHEEHGH
jgi:F-type H+-transporting ATPase subunit a